MWLTRSTSSLWVAGTLTLLLSGAASARPVAPEVFCATYPAEALCAGRVIACGTCHQSTAPADLRWNGYGLAIAGALESGDFVAALPDALRAIEELDSDGDLVPNGEEIASGSGPGDPLSFPRHLAPPAGDPNPAYDVDGYDYPYAFRRLSAAFCGRSPTYEQVADFRAEADPRAALHAKLDECLAGAYWRDVALPRMADPMVRPIAASTSWGWDYRLFRYVMTGGRDVRELLTADYHVRELVPGELTRVDEPFEFLTDAACDGDTDCDADQFCSEVDTVCAFRDEGQPLQRERRAGMITTAWFHWFNTMFAALPRQTAAHAYRSYMGLSIARQEGLLPVEGEPLDPDGKGVKQAECAQCHSTLDPLAYAFAYYKGIEAFGDAGRYDPERPQRLGLWDPGAEPATFLLGQKVADVVQWAEVAAGSDAFARTVTLWLYQHAVGQAPAPEDAETFMALWQGLADVGWSADGLCHAIIDTLPFGGP